MHTKIEDFGFGLLKDVLFVLLMRILERAHVCLAGFCLNLIQLTIFTQAVCPRAMQRADANISKIKLMTKGTINS